jgi:hypothetical protein
MADIICTVVLIVMGLLRKLAKGQRASTQGAVDTAAMRVLLASIRAYAVRDDLDLRQTVAAIDRIIGAES